MKWEVYYSDSLTKMINHYKLREIRPRWKKWIGLKPKHKEVFENLRYNYTDDLSRFLIVDSEGEELSLNSKEVQAVISYKTTQLCSTSN